MKTAHQFLYYLLPMSTFFLVSLPVRAAIEDVRSKNQPMHSVLTIQRGGQATFISPDSAVTNLVDALRQGNQFRVRRILGERAMPSSYTRDNMLNKISNEHFLRAYDEKHSLELSGNGRAILLIGKEEWPLPFPLIKSGKNWIFDEMTGALEWQNRRIGSDEIAAIQVVLAYADAQREYVLQDRNSDGLLEYAQRLASTPGTHNGLYWPIVGNEMLSPLGQAFADAQESLSKRIPSASGHPYHGYYFRILTSQGSAAPGGAYTYLVKDRMIGGFALFAYPESYGVSGIKSFMINHQGIVYSKDLGKETSLLAPKMMSYNPDQSWTKESD